MCTLFIAYQMNPDSPFVIGANRDERYNRPFEKPAIRQSGDNLAVYPLDAEGGTWVGFTCDMFCAITNAYVHDILPDRRSRGFLVRDALSFDNIEKVKSSVRQAIGYTRFNPFRFFAITREAAVVLDNADHEYHERTLTPGLWVLSNHHHLRTYRESSVLPLEKVEQLARTEKPAVVMEALKERLKDHRCYEPDNYIVCKHFDDRGTTSSFLFSLDRDYHPLHFEFCCGHPCENEYDKMKNLVEEICAYE